MALLEKDPGLIDGGVARNSVDAEPMSVAVFT
jgi:hypothetical protein